MAQESILSTLLLNFTKLDNFFHQANLPPNLFLHFSVQLIPLQPLSIHQEVKLQETLISPELIQEIFDVDKK